MTAILTPVLTIEVPREPERLDVVLDRKSVV